MANIGDQVFNPETSWIRINMTDPSITYEGTGWFNNQNYDYITDKLDGACIKFNVKKSNRIRIYGFSWSNRSNQAISINGEDAEVYSNSSANTTYTLIYEKTGLNYENFIRIDPNREMTSGAFFGIACIDIDEGGECVPYNEKIFSYLLKQNSQYYTVKNNSLSLLENQVLDKNNFDTNGFSNLSLLNNIDKTDMKLLVYDESNSEEMTLKFTLKQPFRPIDKFEGKIKILKQEMK